MEISLRDLITVLHGMGFGALFMMAFAGALAELYRFSAPTQAAATMPSETQQRWLQFYLIAMVILAWAAVLSGTYVVYPWYRAVPPEGANLMDFPKFLLTSSPTTSKWHTLGMEWKEHVAWLAPIAITMVAYVTAKYGRALTRPRQLRTAVLAFAAVAFIATGVAGGFGAFINKYAPVRGGPTIQLLGSEPVGGD
jgi:nitrate reductase NapE component